MNDSNYETWLPVEGSPGYEVSNTGLVRSVDRTIERVCRWGFVVSYQLRGRVLATRDNNSGYSYVNLGRDTHEAVHTLVATAFVENPKGLRETNHLDGNRKNNSAANLEWVTRSENVLHSYRALNRKQHCKTKPIRVGATTYPSMLAAANALGVSPGSVYSALHKPHLCCGLEVSRG